MTPEHAAALQLGEKDTRFDAPRCTGLLRDWICLSPASIASISARKLAPQHP